MSLRVEFACSFANSYREVKRFSILFFAEAKQKITRTGQILNRKIRVNHQ